MVRCLSPLVRLLLQLCRPAGDIFGLPGAAKRDGLEQCTTQLRRRVVYVCLRVDWAARWDRRRPIQPQVFDHCRADLLVARDDGDSAFDQVLASSLMPRAGRLWRSLLFPGLNGTDQRVSRARNEITRDGLSSIKRLCGFDCGRRGGGLSGAALWLAFRILSVWWFGRAVGCDLAHCVERAATPSAGR